MSQIDYVLDVIEETNVVETADTINVAEALAALNSREIIRDRFGFYYVNVPIGEAATLTAVRVRPIPASSAKTTRDGSAVSIGVVDLAIGPIKLTSIGFLWKRYADGSYYFRSRRLPRKPRLQQESQNTSQERQWIDQIILAAKGLPALVAAVSGRVYEAEVGGKMRVKLS